MKHNSILISLLIMCSLISGAAFDLGIARASANGGRFHRVQQLAGGTGNAILIGAIFSSTQVSAEVPAMLYCAPAASAHSA